MIRDRLDYAVPWMLAVMLAFIGATELMQLSMPRNKYFHAFEVIQWLYLGLAIDHGLLKAELSTAIHKRIESYYPVMHIAIGVALGVFLAW